MFDLCLPAKLYVIITFLAIILHLCVNYNGVNYDDPRKDPRNQSRSAPYTITAICAKLIIMAIWATLLNWLCKTGHTGLAWIIFLFPLIIIGGIFALVISQLILSGLYN
jgi:hypothetical protein